VTFPIATSYGLGVYAAGEAHVLVTRKDYKPDGSRPGCVYCHSLGAKAMSALDPTLAQPMAWAIANAGLPLLATDLGGTATWGNDTAQARASDAKTALQGAVGGAKAGKVAAIGVSMGGLSSLNWIRANPALVSALALVCPVVDLGYEHDNNVNGYAASIEAAYGGAAGYAAAVAAHDPTQNAAAIAALGIPIQMWRASNDAIAVTARQDAFAQAAGIPVVDLGAIGHTVNAGVPWDSVADWLAQHA
jgi:pimeloyl-ACP methyl ester carboxylesterase